MSTQQPSLRSGHPGPTSPPPSAATRVAPADLRTWTCRLAAVVIPVGPAAVALLRFVLPYETNQSSSAAVDGIRAHPGTQSAVVWLGLLAVLTLVPGVLWVGRLARRRAPRLTDAALWFAARHDL